MAHAHEAELEAHNHSITTKFMASFADDAILGLVREYKARYDQIFCTDFDGMYSDVLDWDAFREVGEPCTQAGSENAEDWVCQQVGSEVAEGSGLRYVNQCTTEKLINQLRLAVEEIEGLDPNATYDPGSPVYGKSKMSR